MVQVASTDWSLLHLDRRLRIWRTCNTYSECEVGRHCMKPLLDTDSTRATLVLDSAMGTLDTTTRPTTRLDLLVVNFPRANHYRCRIPHWWKFCL